MFSRSLSWFLTFAWSMEKNNNPTLQRFRQCFLVGLNAQLLKLHFYDRPPLKCLLWVHCGPEECLDVKPFGFDALTNITLGIFLLPTTSNSCTFKTFHLRMAKAFCLCLCCCKWTWSVGWHIRTFTSWPGFNLSWFGTTLRLSFLFFLHFSIPWSHGWDQRVFWSGHSFRWYLLSLLAAMFLQSGETASELSFWNNTLYLLNVLNCAFTFLIFVKRHLKRAQKHFCDFFFFSSLWVGEEEKIPIAVVSATYFYSNGVK